MLQLGKFLVLIRRGFLLRGLVRRAVHLHALVFDIAQRLGHTRLLCCRGFLLFLRAWWGMRKNGGIIYGFHPRRLVLVVRFGLWTLLRSWLWYLEGTLCQFLSRSFCLGHLQPSSLFGSALCFPFLIEVVSPVNVVQMSFESGQWQYLRVVQGQRRRNLHQICQIPSRP